MSADQQQTERPTFEQMGVMAKAVADSKMFGVENQAQAMALMLLCQAEGLHPIMALRRYHIIEGRPAFRADALQGEFEKEGAILWHQRDEKMCAATFFRHHVAHLDAQAIPRAKERFKRLCKGEDASDLAQVDEVTIIRTIEDAVAKRVAMRWDKTGNKWVMKHNWLQSPRQMLHARCLTEGVRAVNPGLIAGVYIEDEILDIPAEQRTEVEGMDQRPYLEIAERNVRQATANAAAENLTESVRIADNDEIPGVPSPSPISQLPSSVTAVTRGNYQDVVVHIGKAEGEMLGKRVGDLHPNIIEWLYTKWRDKLSPLSDEADLRLKAAIEFAYEAQRAAPAPASVAIAPGATQDLRATTERDIEAATPADGDDSPRSPISQRTLPAVAGSAILHTKDEVIAELRDRISDLVITEEQACAYLRREGVFEKEEHFADAPESMLRFLLRPDMWNTLKDVVEADMKPKPAETAPPKKRARKGDLK
jgi:hypothetical protein